MGIRTFQYQALARALTASLPPVDVPFIDRYFTEGLPIRSRQRWPWAESSVTFSAVTVPAVPPDPRTMPRNAVSAEPLPIVTRRLHAEHQQVQSRGDPALPTLPMPQRAYTSLEPPNPPQIRFRAWNDRAETTWPSYNVPMPVWQRHGSEPLPIMLRRVGVCHAVPDVVFSPPQALPIPTMAYSVNELPVRSIRPLHLDATAHSAPWFSTTLFFGAYFTPSPEPAPKRPARLNGESSQVIHVQTFAAPTYCWSQTTEPLPLVRQTTAHSWVSFSGAPDKSPLLFGREQYQPTRAVARIDVTQASVIRTENENTSIAARCFATFELPSRKPALRHWQSWTTLGTASIGGAGGGTVIVEPHPPLNRPCLEIALVGTDATDIALTGDGGASPQPIALTGTDATDIALTGEC